MRTVRRRLTSWRHLWLMVVLLARISGTTTAQTAPAQEADLERVLVPGKTVWLTDAPVAALVAVLSKCPIRALAVLVAAVV